MILETNSTSGNVFGRATAWRKAFPGQVITLTGDLGVGKTVFYTGTCQRTWHRRTGKQSDLYDRAGV